MSAGFLLRMLRKRRRQRREAAAKRAAGDEEAQQAPGLPPLPLGAVESSGSGGGSAQLPVSVPQEGVSATPATEAQRLWERFRRVGWAAVTFQGDHWQNGRSDVCCRPLTWRRVCVFCRGSTAHVSSSYGWVCTRSAIRIGSTDGLRCEMSNSVHRPGSSGGLMP